MTRKPRADHPAADKATVVKLISALEAVYIDLTVNGQVADGLCARRGCPMRLWA